ncbi:DUF4262 domain-containing protein [Kribbella sp. NPDC051620]|uniref:DUF4262 domain-containing protein n=1 Tax=Kribbella sp. NPDC051620 TaxID=3364120 RepID=UPI003790458D
MLAELVELIDRHGWAVRHVGAGDQPGEAAFSYTVGLTALDHPEVVVVGMPFEHSQGFLNLIGSLVREGRTFLPGTTTHDLTDGSYVAFITVTDIDELTAVDQIYGSVEALQMIWPDSRGKMPWDDGYKNGPLAQPFLGPLPGHWTVA